MTYFQGTQDTSIMYSETEDRRDQENEGQRGDCSIIVIEQCTGVKVESVPDRQWTRGYKGCEMLI